VTPQGDGKYSAQLGAEWNCPIVPQGGMVVATIARAMTAALDDPAQTLRSISAVFAEPVAAGESELDVTVLRRGRSMSQCSASMRNPGNDAGTHAVAVFGAPRRGFDIMDLTPPEVRPPHECVSFNDPPPPDVEWEEDPDFEPFPFWLNVEGRPALGTPPWEDKPESERQALRCVYYRFQDPPRLDDGQWDPLAVVALCDTMPGAVGERIGPRAEMWMPPSADFTVHMFGPVYSDYVLMVNRARFAGEGYASVDLEMWDTSEARPRLAAYATQMMFFAFPKPA
jgi:acyl-CoA thioesterase